MPEIKDESIIKKYEIQTKAVNIKKANITPVK